MLSNVPLIISNITKNTSINSHPRKCNATSKFVLLIVSIFPEIMFKYSDNFELVIALLKPSIILRLGGWLI